MVRGPRRAFVAPIELSIRDEHFHGVTVVHGVNYLRQHTGHDIYRVALVVADFLTGGYFNVHGLQPYAFPGVLPAAGMVVVVVVLQDREAVGVADLAVALAVIGGAGADGA